MATKKQEISKHKAAIARRPVSAKPTSDASQVFDIVPRGRVRATATSRPVITGNKPEVSDNTLATAPTLDLKRNKELNLAPDLDEKGVSVGDLLAKRAEAKTEAKADDNSDDKPGADVEPGSTFDLSPDGKIDGEARPNDEAVSEKAKYDPLLDMPDSKDDDAAATMVDDHGKDVTETIDSDDALVRALQGGAAAKPQEHSDALKEEIKNLDSGDSSDGRQHHELYGGKPVIVVHKDRGTLSAVTWLLWFLLCILLAVAIVDLLLDAGIVKTNYSIPYTDFIKD